MQTFRTLLHESVSDLEFLGKEKTAEYKAKKQFADVLERRIDDYESERSEFLLKIENGDMARLLKKAEKYSKNYRIRTEKRRRFKIILKRASERLTEDEAINLYLVLRHELNERLFN